ncbi:MAG TPA: heme ABC transporter ATP-binding protein [Nordella sp.]|nr:heme ABC transporter ATP-binding protein [Nordella sp.]
MFTADHISLSYGVRPVLSDVSLTLARGELVIILGPNGAGKSTLLKVLTGDLEPDEGRVSFDGKPLARIALDALARERAVLSQSTGLNFPFTVFEVVRLGLEAGRGTLSKAEAQRLLPRALKAVGLDGFEGRLHQQLSGGEQQRVHLARVLCQAWAGKPDGSGFLLLDEPVSNLDIRHQLQTLEAVRRHVTGGGGALMILHDINLAALYADRLVMMADGRIRYQGKPQDVLDRAAILDVYGVDMPVEIAPATGRPFALLSRPE